MDFGGKLEELNLTRDEVNRIGEALKDEQFRALLGEYAEEISNPENRRLYEEEIRRLEEDRGVQVQFIHPTAHHVLKSRDENGKCFINICSNRLIDEPRSEASTDGQGRPGQRWHIPFSLTPARPDRDSSGNPCVLYDAVFHPDALRMADNDARFTKLIHSTAIGGIRDSFQVKLDGDKIKRLKMKYKGVPHPAVIRRPIPGNAAKPPPKSPHYTVKYRSVVDLQDYRFSRDSGPGVRPSAIVVTVDLPLLTSVRDADVRVKEKRLVLETAEYRLDVPLSYPVDEEKGEAKFNKTKKQLTITLPVRPAQMNDLSHHNDTCQSSDSSSNTNPVSEFGDEDVHHHSEETQASCPDHPPSSETLNPSVKMENLESFKETEDTANEEMENTSRPSDPPPKASSIDSSNHNDICQSSDSSSNTNLVSEFGDEDIHHHTEETQASFPDHPPCPKTLIPAVKMENLESFKETEDTANEEMENTSRPSDPPPKASSIDSSNHNDICQSSDTSSNTNPVSEFGDEDVHHHTEETQAFFPDHPPSSEMLNPAVNMEDLESFKETEDTANTVMENTSSPKASSIDSSNHNDICQSSDSSSNTKLEFGDEDVHHHTSETEASIPDHPPSSEMLNSILNNQKSFEETAEEVMENTHSSSDPPPKEPNTCHFQNSIWFDLD